MLVQWSMTAPEESQGHFSVLMQKFNNFVTFHWKCDFVTREWVIFNTDIYQRLKQMYQQLLT